MTRGNYSENGVISGISLFHCLSATQMDETLTFGAWHKRRRKALGLTQDSLARLIGCSTVTVKKIESDDLQASVHLSELIATHLQIPPMERSDFISWARGGKIPVKLTSLETTWQSHVPTPDPTRRTSSLPAQLTHVIGRDDEIKVGCNLLLQSSIRVLTLTGPPGIGKTRLSIQIATAMQHQFSEGVWFVSLAALRDPALMPSSIAHVLGVRELPGHTMIETLQEYLRDKKILLVLDNFEHVIKAASVVRDLLVATSGVKILVTSREILHLYGEHEFPVPPLALPANSMSTDARRVPSVDDILASPAVALFIERAQAVKPDFELNTDNATVIVEICEWLDGLPLAIEMAAARVKWLMPRALLARLSQRLVLLTSGPRDLSARQQTLRGAIDWSYDLLDSSERLLFARFSVFAGGSDSIAAQMILDFNYPLVDATAITEHRGVLRMDILAGLRSLTDKSLLRIIFPHGPNPEQRFGMLDTLREYAYDKLSNSGEAWAMRDRHLAYYMQWVRIAEPHLHGPQQIQWLDRIESEHDNLRAALNWAIENGDAGQEFGLRLAGTLGWFWRVHGHLSEGLRYILAILKQNGVANAGDLRAKALTAAGVLAFYRADYKLAAALLEESIAISRITNDTANLAFALHNLGNCYWYQGSQAMSLALHEESVVLYRAMSDQWGTAVALSGLGSVLGYQGEYISSRAMFEESLAISAAIGDKWVAAFSLWNLGDVMYGQGEYQSAGDLYLRSLPLARELGDKPNIAFVLAKLASLSMQWGDYSHLEEYAIEALNLFREMGDRWQPPFILRMQGYVALNKGQFREATLLCEESMNLNDELGDERGMIAAIVALASVSVARRDIDSLQAAARLFGAVDTLLAEREIQLLPPDVRTYSIHKAILRDELDSTSLCAAYAIGSALDLRQVAAIALNKPTNSG